MSGMQLSRKPYILDKLYLASLELDGATVSVSCDLLVKIIAAAGLEMSPPRAA